MPPMAPLTRTLLLINIAVFVGQLLLPGVLEQWFALWPTGTGLFNPWQLITYAFLHGGIAHILFNMFALWMFGATLENYWGGKRFLIYYMITGLGAGLMQMAVTETQIFMAAAQMTSEQVQLIQQEGLALLLSDRNYMDPAMASYNQLINAPMVGASGAVFGLLLAFGMTFPNAVIYLYFAIPIKAKYFVVLYGLFELFSGVRNASGDNVAHFAHLGGMFFGFFLILYWRKHPTRFH